MKEMLQVINKMRDAGVITNYAIGGAIGALYYLEAVSTIDVDIFTSFDEPESSSLNPLGPIFDYLRPLGFGVTGEHLNIAGEFVQFLPASDPLLKEALDNAIEAPLFDVPSRVMTAEHLMAIALRLGRAKDLARVEQFIELEAFNESKLEKILAIHSLLDKWKSFKSNRQSP